MRIVVVVPPLGFTAPFSVTPEPECVEEPVVAEGGFGVVKLWTAPVTSPMPLEASTS